MCTVTPAGRPATHRAGARGPRIAETHNTHPVKINKRYAAGQWSLTPFHLDPGLW